MIEQTADIIVRINRETRLRAILEHLPPQYRNVVELGMAYAYATAALDLAQDMGDILNRTNH